MFVMPLRHAACTLGSQVLQPKCASKQLCTPLSNQKMVADISHQPPDQYLTCTAEISDRCSNCAELVLQEAMELTADQKARIVTNRRRLLLRLEALIQRQSAAVEVLQENVPLQVRAHAGTCAHAVFCAAYRATCDVSAMSACMHLAEQQAAACSNHRIESTKVLHICSSSCILL